MIDSMPITVCRCACTKRYIKVTGAQYDGKCYSKNERYFGWKHHLVCGSDGIPTRYVVCLAQPYDIIALMIWRAYCHLGRFYLVIVAPLVNHFGITSMRMMVSP